MSNRLEQKFSQLNSQGKKAFITFITAGDPDLSTTEKLVLSFEKAGVDIVELGVPFSDPLADGPTIQAASYRALLKDTNLDDILKLVKKIRTQSEIPIVLMTYYNPVFHFGEVRFIKEAKEAGVDGVIIPDLPVEEGSDITLEAQKNKLSTIFFISPTTTVSRIPKIIKASSGFIYYVSLTGVTGFRQELPSDLISDIRKVKKMTKQPICVGFGISTAAHVKSIGQVADGVIIGSAIVKKIAEYGESKDLVSKVTKFVSELKKGLDNV